MSTTLTVQLNNLLRSPMYDRNGVMTFAWSKFFQGLAGPTSLTVTLASNGSLSVNDYGIITGITAPTLIPNENFADSESPSGAFNSTNTIFHLVHSPDPPSSLKLYLNGMRLAIASDYMIVGTQISLAAAPNPGDILIADYRY